MRATITAAATSPIATAAVQTIARAPRSTRTHRHRDTLVMVTTPVRPDIGIATAAAEIGFAQLWKSSI
jgi:hypothetical protein